MTHQKEGRIQRRTRACATSGILSEIPVSFCPDVANICTHHTQRTRRFLVLCISDIHTQKPCLPVPRTQLEATWLFEIRKYRLDHTLGCSSRRYSACPHTKQWSLQGEGISLYNTNVYRDTLVRNPATPTFARLCLGEICSSYPDNRCAQLSSHHGLVDQL